MSQTTFNQNNLTAQTQQLVENHITQIAQDLNISRQQAIAVIHSQAEGRPEVSRPR